MNFSEGGREMALYSGPRSSLDGVKQSLQKSKGERGESEVGAMQVP